MDDERIRLASFYVWMNHGDKPKSPCAVLIEFKRLVERLAVQKQAAVEPQKSMLFLKGLDEKGWNEMLRKLNGTMDWDVVEAADTKSSGCIGVEKSW